MPRVVERFKKFHLYYYDSEVNFSEPQYEANGCIVVTALCSYGRFEGKAKTEEATKIGAVRCAKRTYKENARNGVTSHSKKAPFYLSNILDFLKEYSLSYIFRNHKFLCELQRRCKSPKTITLLHRSIRTHFVLQQCIDGELPEVETVAQLVNHLDVN